MRKVGYLWDIDGVVVDSPHEQAWLAASTRPRWKVRGFSPGFYLNYVSSKPRMEGAKEILTRLPWQGKDEFIANNNVLKKEIKEFAECKNNILLSMIRKGQYSMYRSSIMMILEQRKRGMPVAAVSASGNANTIMSQVLVYEVVAGSGPLYEPWCSRCGINRETRVIDLFDINVCGLHFPEGKKGLIRDAAERIREDIDPEIQKFAVFEDGLTGIAAANELGYVSIGLNRIGSYEDFRKSGADLVFPDISDTSYDEIYGQIVKGQA